MLLDSAVGGLLAFPPPPLRFQAIAPRPAPQKLAQPVAASSECRQSPYAWEELPGETPRGSPRRTTPRGPPHGAPIHVLPMRPMYVPKPLFQHLNFP